MEIGAQFYTIRSACQDLAGLEESLKKVADIGYKTIQLSGVCAYEPEWIRDKLAENGLRCVLTHSPCDRMIAETAAVCAEHDVYNCKHIGIGYYDIAACGMDAFVEKFAPVGEAMHKLGHQLMYHNHHMEFAKLGDSIIMQQLIDRFTPEQLGVTMDTFWVQAGGGDPAQWLRKLEGRTPCIHFKDMTYDRKMTPVGEGNLNWDAIFAAAEDTHVQYALVEQDDCNGEDPFDCLARSYAFLKANGLQ